MIYWLGIHNKWTKTVKEGKEMNDTNVRLVACLAVGREGRARQLRRAWH
jgi:hypothetical protein